MSKRVLDARQKELEAITYRARYFGGMMLLSTGVPAAVSVLTLLCFSWLQGGNLTASIAFTSLSLFGLLREAIISATYLLSTYQRARVSFERIATFLDQGEELDASSRTFEGEAIRFENAKLQWSEGADGFTLQVDKLEIPMGKLTVVAGEVGSGKSALCMALLGELKLVSGSVKLPPQTSIACVAAHDPR